MWRDSHGFPDHRGGGARTLADVHAWLAFYEQFSAERLDALDNLLRTRTRKERSK